MPATRKSQIPLHDLLLAVAIAGVLLAWVIPVARVSTIWVAAFSVPTAFVIMTSFRRFTALQILMMVTVTCATVALPLIKGDAWIYAKYAATLLLVGAVWLFFHRRRRRQPRALREP